MEVVEVVEVVGGRMSVILAGHPVGNRSSYQPGEKPVPAALVESVLSRHLDDLEQIFLSARDRRPSLMCVNLPGRRRTGRGGGNRGLRRDSHAAAVIGNWRPNALALGGGDGAIAMSIQGLRAKVAIV